MNQKIVYAPGPTEVRENVRLKRAEKTTNPDVDVEFVEFYKKTCEKIAQIINTKNEVYIFTTPFPLRNGEAFHAFLYPHFYKYQGLILR